MNWFGLKRYNVRFRRSRISLKLLMALCLSAFIIFASSCVELEKPEPDTFYSETDPPAKQEFRWTNGKMPKSFDPAMASAPPETDVVRAVFDGLTENDPKTLKAIPAISNEWSSSDDKKVWTFKLRKDAKWSNGEKITAKDFVRSWKRLSEMGEKVSHHEFLRNIVGMEIEKNTAIKKTTESNNLPKSDEVKGFQGVKNEVLQKESEDNLAKPKQNDSILAVGEKKNQPFEIPKKVVKSKALGVKAIGNYTLEVTLIRSDKDFPNLVTHPIFRPVYASGREFEKEELNANVVTSGAFRISSVGRDGVTLDRSETYYNREEVKLERVRFVPMKDADSALEAYRNGEVDAVTNARIEPLALKLLTPYVDFKRTTHSALNFYEFNRKNEPFNDRRVRQALAVSIDRERITKDEMDGATKPAFNFLPFKQDKNRAKFDEDVIKAKSLLEMAGFPNGEGFPTIKLVVNRNNVQQRIAKSVAKMWKENLKVETEIVVKDLEQVETAKIDGDFDIIRQGVVLPTTDETANMLAIFSPKKVLKVEVNKKKAKTPNGNSVNKTASNSNTSSNTNALSNSNVSSSGTPPENELLINTGDDEKIILTEEEAISEVPAIPLYFPTSYSLVKPYVLGFEMNTLDAPLLKDVRIDNNWRPKVTKEESPN